MSSSRTMEGRFMRFGAGGGGMRDIEDPERLVSAVEGALSVVDMVAIVRW